MVLVSAVAGLLLAGQGTSLQTTLALATGLTLVVSSANALNCWIERDVDRFMSRTAGRPLPARRLHPRLALWFSVSVGVASVPMLWVFVNPLTALLGLVSLLSYVFLYTPMKQVSPWAVYVGAVPGAMPPLMGWCAATGTLGDFPSGGVILFLILFAWQIPHFAAIATVRREEYTAAGIRVISQSRGGRSAFVHGIFWCVVLLALHGWAMMSGLGSWTFFTLSTASAMALTVAVVLGLRGGSSERARIAFFVSLAHVPAVFLGLLLDRLIAGA